jgi:hypothetical protein
MGPLQSSPAFVDPAYIYSTDSSSVLRTPITSLPLSSWNHNAAPPASVPQVTTGFVCSEHYCVFFYRTNLGIEEVMLTMKVFVC